jgi:hypothetical protein
MVVAAGNLDGLVGMSFGTSQLVGVAIVSYSQAADGSVIDVLTQVLTTPSGLSPGGGANSTFTIAAVNDAANQIVVSQVGSSGGAQAFDQSTTYNVLAYNPQSLFVSTLSLSGLVAALQAQQDVSGAFGVISAAPATPGSFLAFTPNGTFSGTLPCFALGTRILTDAGEVPVQAIRVGDLVPGQRSGKLRPVCWVGRRTLELATHARPWDVAPVCVRAHALAPGRPRRDLLLSPDHSVLVQGVLIPVRYLINGRTVLQQRPARVTYLHVELDGHDVLLAEGLPCESFLDTGNKQAFAEAAPLSAWHRATSFLPPLHRAARRPALGEFPHG